MKKFFKIFGYCILAIICALNIYVIISGKFFVYKALIFNFANIDDYKIFEQRKVQNDPNHISPWPVASNYNKIPLSPALDSALTNLKSVAFLVIQNDSIIHEQYWDNYGDTSISNSFSVAKSIVGTLIGIAIDEGKIKSVDQPVGDFLPNFKEGEKSKITIRHLLCMSGGTDWEESYASPISITTEAYYGSDLKQLINRLNAKESPGKFFDYKSGDTQILSFVLKKATGMSISEYASAKLWSKIGAEKPALWSLDRYDGDEKAYCCFFTNARDFARIGQLYLNKGMWNGQKIVSEEFIKQATSPNMLLDKFGSKVDYYGWQWWLVPSYRNTSFYYARGIGGQFVIVLPEKKSVIVRLGHKRGIKLGNASHYLETFQMVDWVLDNSK